MGEAGVTALSEAGCSAPCPGHSQCHRFVDAQMVGATTDVLDEAYSAMMILAD